MEQLRKEIIEIIDSISCNEKALRYVHGFLKVVTKRYK